MDFSAYEICPQSDSIGPCPKKVFLQNIFSCRFLGTLSCQIGFSTLYNPKNSFFSAKFENYIFFFLSPGSFDLKAC